MLLQHLFLLRWQPRSHFKRDQESISPLDFSGCDTKADDSTSNSARGTDNYKTEIWAPWQGVKILMSRSSHFFLLPFPLGWLTSFSLWQHFSKSSQNSALLLFLHTDCPGSMWCQWYPEGATKSIWTVRHPTILTHQETCIDIKSRRMPEPSSVC